ncbi:MAG: hypothetical protein M3Y87_15490 [Myxococcota bacterium]|nr:hypothetical protein [Myxococcota bacterium]
MRFATLLVLVLVLLPACGSCGGGQRLPQSDRVPVPVELTIVNETAETIYLASQAECVFGPLSITQAGETLDIHAGQSLTCEGAQQGPCHTMGGCEGAGVRPLRAGERWTMTWSGIHYVDARIDPSEAGEGCPTDCVVALAAEAGPAQARVDAYSRCELPGCDCDVTLSSSGCHPAGALEGAPDLRAEAQLTIPERAGAPLEVELAFR